MIPVRRSATGRRTGIAIVTSGALLVAVTLFVPAVAAQDRSRIRELVDRIARGDDVEAEDAARELSEAIAGPLGSAIGSLEARPPAEVVRLRAAVQRVHAAIEMRLRRATLSESDRKLFDDFAEHYGELLLQVFDTRAEVRQAAVGDIPREPNTGAGLMLGFLIDDYDSEVADAALRAAEKMRDPVLTRRVVHYIRDATQAVRQGHFPASQLEIAQEVGAIVCRCCKLIGLYEAKDAAPHVAEALTVFARDPYWPGQDTADIVIVLEKLGDARVSHALLPLIELPELWDGMQTAQGVTLRSTIGDRTLLALFRLNRLSPEEFGMTLGTSRRGDFGGFANEEARRESVRKFRAWYERNGPRGEGADRVPASAPSTRPK